MSVNNRWFQLGASLDRDDHDREPAVCVDAVRQAAPGETGWRLSDIQFAFTLFILFQTWVQPLDGWLIDRLGPRGFISAAGLLCGLGWAGMGYATSLPMLYTLYCIAGIGAAFVYSGSIGSALKWFKDRRGLAVGHHGGGVRRRHGALHPAHFLDDRVAAAISRRSSRPACLQGVVILVVAQFLRHPPPEPVDRANTRRRSASRSADRISRRWRCSGRRSST